MACNKVKRPPYGDPMNHAGTVEGGAWAGRREGGERGEEGEGGWEMGGWSGEVGGGGVGGPRKEGGPYESWRFSEGRHFTLLQHRFEEIVRFSSSTTTGGRLRKSIASSASTTSRARASNRLRRDCTNAAVPNKQARKPAPGRSIAAATRAVLTPVTNTSSGKHRRAAFVGALSAPPGDAGGGFSPASPGGASAGVGASACSTAAAPSVVPGAAEASVGISRVAPCDGSRDTSGASLARLTAANATPARMPNDVPIARLMGPNRSEVRMLWLLGLCCGACSATKE